MWSWWTSTSTQNRALWMQGVEVMRCFGLSGCTTHMGLVSVARHFAMRGFDYRHNEGKAQHRMQEHRPCRDMTNPGRCKLLEHTCLLKSSAAARLSCHPPACSRAPSQQGMTWQFSITFKSKDEQQTTTKQAWKVRQLQGDAVAGLAVETQCTHSRELQAQAAPRVSPAGCKDRHCS